MVILSVRRTDYDYDLLGTAAGSAPKIVPLAAQISGLIQVEREGPGATKPVSCATGEVFFSSGQWLRCVVQLSCASAGVFQVCWLFRGQI